MTPMPQLAAVEAAADQLALLVAELDPQAEAAHGPRAVEVDRGTNANQITT